MMSIHGAQDDSHALDSHAPVRPPNGVSDLVASEAFAAEMLDGLQLRLPAKA
jgi:hypothetical protein